jgi:hypothetical protein
MFSIPVEKVKEQSMAVKVSSVKNLFIKNIFLFPQIWTKNVPTGAIIVSICNIL